MIEQLCPLRITLLGSFNLEIGGVDIKEEEWKSKKALTMLKYLAAKKGQKISSDTLIELLWPENQSLDSTGNLHTAVWFVRRVLHGAYLQYSNGSYWLDLGDDGCIDVDEFEMHVGKSKQLEMDNPDLALHHCNLALRLYHEEFLYEDVYDDWTVHYRDYYKERYFEVAVRTANLLRTHLADYKEAVRVCREALRKDPYREEIYQACFRALISDERYVDAINMYRNFSILLKTEFQLEPSPATQNIIHDVRRYLVKNEVLPVISVESMEAQGAYTCGRVIFQALLNIEQRRFERNDRHFSMLIFYIKNSSTLMQHHSQEAFKLLQHALRRADIICQWSANTVTIFLPETNAVAAKETLQRLNFKLSMAFKDVLEFDCDILSSEYLGDIHEKFQSILGHQ